MTLPVAILAGGRATRLGALGAETPKSLVEVAGRPLAVHQIELLARHGATHLVFCVGHLGEQIVSALGDGSRWGMTFEYAHDGPVLLGTGGSLRGALDRLGRSFLVLYGDSYLECDYGAVEQAFLRGGTLALMTVCRNPDRGQRSNVRFERGRILAYDKHSDDPRMQHMDYGLNAFHRDALLPYPPGAPFDLGAVHRDLLARGELAAYEIDGRYREAGSPEGVADLDAHLRQHGESRA